MSPAGKMGEDLRSIEEGKAPYVERLQSGPVRVEGLVVELDKLLPNGVDVGHLYRTIDA